jgi:hypothetical protein
MRILIFLLMAGSVFAAQTAVHDITAYTSTATGVREFNVLVFSDEGKILATGDESLLEDYPDAIRIDGKGRTLLPGLTDAHAHMSGLGFLTISLDLSGVPSVSDAVRRIAEYAATAPHSSWIQGRGWNQVLWPVKEFPTAADIDAVVSDRPVWLRRVDGHAGWANSTTLTIAGIDDDTPDPIGGKIVRDDAGKATGVLIDKAMGLVTAHIPPPSKNDIRNAYSRASAYLLSLGMTGVHDAGIDIREAEVYMSMADDRELDMRIYAMLSGAGNTSIALASPYGSTGKIISTLLL